MSETFPPHPDICFKCKHYRGDNYIEKKDNLEGDHVNQCDAFPDEIPYEILIGENRHIKSFPGDHGIQFESIKKASKE